MVRDEAERRQVVLVRMPVDLKTWVEGKAAQDERSQNAFIVRTLRGMMDAEQRKREKAAG